MSDSEFDFDLKDESWLQDGEHDPDLSLSVIQSHNLERYIRAKLKETTTKMKATKEEEDSIKERWQLKIGAKKELINLSDIVVKRFIDHILEECIDLLQLMQKKQFTPELIVYVFNKVHFARSRDI